MTVATNALLEGRTARTALIATAGFTDVIELGRQARAHLYDLCRSAPAPLVPRRAALRGARAHRARTARCSRSIPRWRARWSAEIAPRRHRGDRRVRCFTPTPIPTTSACSAPSSPSSRTTSTCRSPRELVGTFREYERTATTVLDAALSPLLAAYLRRLSGDARARGLPEPLDHAVLGRPHRLARAPPPTPR